MTRQCRYNIQKQILISVYYMSNASKMFGIDFDERTFNVFKCCKHHYLVDDRIIAFSSLLSIENCFTYALQYLSRNTIKF